MLTAVLLSTILAAPLAFGQGAGGYDLLDIPPPSGYLARRTWLADYGVSMDIRYTMFYQGLASGTGGKDFNFGDKIDAFINLDSSKLGLREGGGFRSHIEYSRDNAPTNLGGAIFAAKASSVMTGLFCLRCRHGKKRQTTFRDACLIDYLWSAPQSSRVI